MAVLKQKWVLSILAAIWLSSIVVGLAILSRHENSAGLAGIPPANWPTDSKILRTKDRLTLVLFGHPQCPCTRATIGELALLMARCQGKLDARVLFIKPAGTPDNWEKTDLWQSASIIPGVTVQTDIDGQESNRFHALTSGQTVLYDTDGRLLFQGGITLSRGHSGDNPGRSAITEIVHRRTGIDIDIAKDNAKDPEQTQKEKVSTAVFGCSLCRPGDGDNGAMKTGGEGRE